MAFIDVPFNDMTAWQIAIKAVFERVMSATSINSISEFLLHAGTEYQVFDLGVA